jgi:hypothetical protein
MRIRRSINTTVGGTAPLARVSAATSIATPIPCSGSGSYFPSTTSAYAYAFGTRTRGVRRLTNGLRHPRGCRTISRTRGVMGRPAGQGIPDTTICMYMHTHIRMLTGTRTSHCIRTLTNPHLTTSSTAVVACTTIRTRYINYLEVKPRSPVFPSSSTSSSLPSRDYRRAKLDEESTLREYVQSWQTHRLKSEHYQPIRYSFESLIVNEFHTINGLCGNLVPSGPSSWLVS